MKKTLPHSPPPSTQPKPAKTVKKNRLAHFLVAARPYLLFVLIFVSFVTLAFTSAFSFAGGNNQINSNEHYHVVLSHPNGYADSGFNQQAVEAICLKYAKKMDKDKTNCDYTRSEFRDYVSYGYAGSASNPSMLYKYIMNKHRTLNIKNFVLPGFQYLPFIKKYIKELKKESINIISVDTSYKKGENETWPSNLYQVVYRHYYAGYHAGLYAGAYALKHSSKFEDADSTTDGKQIHFGAIVGKNVPPIFNYVWGFKLGLERASTLTDDFSDSNNNDGTVKVDLRQYEVIAGFDPVVDADKTRTLAQNMYAQKVSVIFVVAGALTKSVALVAEEENAKSDYEHYVVGVDVDQGAIFFNEPANSVEHRAGGKQKAIAITSATINLRQAIKDVMDKIADEDSNDDADEYYAHGHSKENDGVDYGTIPARFRDDDEIWTILKKKLDDDDDYKLSKILKEEEEEEATDLKGKTMAKFTEWEEADNSGDSNGKQNSSSNTNTNNNDEKQGIYTLTEAPENFVDNVIGKAMPWAKNNGVERSKEFVELLKGETTFTKKTE